MAHPQVSLCPVTSADHPAVAHVSFNMRHADRLEAEAAFPWTAAEGMRRSIAMSFETWAGLADGEAVCIFGYGSIGIASGIAVPWLLATDALDRYRFAFLRRNRDVIARWLTIVERLENHVDVRHTESLRWLEWLGFTLDPAAPFGFLGKPFRRAWIERARPRVAAEAPSCA